MGVLRGRAEIARSCLGPGVVSAIEFDEASPAL